MLVILAILAAILVPALLGWIDKAKEKQYVLDARSVYVAAQAFADEAYAGGLLDGDSPKYSSLEDYLTDDDVLNEVISLSDVEHATIKKVTSATTDDVVVDKHAKYVIASMTVTIDSQDLTLKDGTWVMGDGC